MPQLREKTVYSKDGTALFVADWLLPHDAPNGGVVILHGLGEHAGRHHHMAQFFNECGFAVRTYDHRGHGKSGGTRGDVPNSEALLRDAQQMVDDFALEDSRPPILFGHSMGGLFAAKFALKKLSPLSAVILSSPALAVFLAPWQQFLFNSMRRIAPGFALPTSLPVRYLSHDDAVIQAYKDDALVHGRISARTMESILNAIEYCQSHAAQLSIPCFLQVAGADRLVNPEGSFQFFPKLPKALVSMQVYPELYHEIFNELASEQVFADLRRWLQSGNLLEGTSKNLLRGHLLHL